eukprot:scaffold242710_cov37-Tisochrysis_lutea.AAC.2
MLLRSANSPRNRLSHAPPASRLLSIVINAHHLLQVARPWLLAKPKALWKCSSYLQYCCGSSCHANCSHA